MIYLPPQKIAQGEPFHYDFTVIGQDWTGYTGTATYKVVPGDTEALLSVPVTANAGGMVQIDLTAEQTRLLPALPRIGFYHRAICEVALGNGTDAQTFQMRVSVAGKL